MTTQLFWKPTVWENRLGAKGVTGKVHDEAIKLVRDELPGLVILDGDDDRRVTETRISGQGLQRIRWKRYEIESYLLHPDVLSRFVEKIVGEEVAPLHNFLGRVGQATNRPFPWVVSDFGLIEAIESGLVKIPQLAVRDSTGAAIPGYFNIWHWILPQLTPSERGGKKANPKPEAILKYAHHPIAMLGSLWQETIKEWQSAGQDKRPPVFILVCKNTQIAKVVYEWLAENEAPTGIPPAHIEGFKNNEKIHTIRVDSKVTAETDTGEAKSDEARWMRFTLDTVGKAEWPKDDQRMPIYPKDFEELAQKLNRPLDPPGRDVRCHHQ